MISMQCLWPCPVPHNMVGATLADVVRVLRAHGEGWKMDMDMHIYMYLNIYIYTNIP